MNDSQDVTLWLKKESRTTLDGEARRHGVSLSAYINALGRIMKYPITMKTPMLEIRYKFRELLQEELERRSR